MKLKNKPHTNGTKALFNNPLLEKLTRTHIAIPLIIFSVISASLIYFGIDYGYISALNAPLLFVGGLLTFTLVEYIMHRFVFHLTPHTPKQEKFAYTVHGVHHDYPKDKDRLAMPPPLSLLLAAGFFFLFRLIMGDFVFGFLPGFLMGYASYLWVHYMVHAFKPPKNFFKVLWVHHGIHHYKDENNAFGVSSPLWDYIFRTMPKK
ncbi:sterol desaturase family protein [Marinoscillum sp. MHG1-6]|uniref:sterol desaturase family protein n=1 Tax=Marinoscillum sp. MHG1-6 TaxID=2959627 RepID=UPI0021575A11|nr:sterol desaturase family protein [Marinoscillum sp. MHG1-6]